MSITSTIVNTICRMQFKQEDNPLDDKRQKWKLLIFRMQMQKMETTEVPTKAQVKVAAAIDPTEDDAAVPRPGDVSEIKTVYD